MLVTVQNIFKSLSPAYQLKCIAGKNGLDNIAEWASIVEDDDATQFRNRNVIFTQGMHNTREDYLLRFAQKLNHAGDSAFIVKTGVYVKEIPQNLIEYCNEAAFPLYSLPQDVLMVDVVRDICHFIIHEESTHSNTAGIIQNIIFNIGDSEPQINSLERYGFSMESVYCPVILKIEQYKDDESLDILSKDLELHCAKIAHASKLKIISFLYNHLVILIFVNPTRKSIDAFINSFFQNLSLKYQNLKIYICVGPNTGDIYTLPRSFKKTMLLVKIAVRNKISVLYYDQMGIFKLIAEITEYNVLKDYCKCSLGKLMQSENGKYSGTLQILKAYLECNGNVATVAEKFFVHRNTVNNQLKRVEKITGISPLTIEGKTQFLIAFQILDFLDFNTDSEENNI